MIVLEFHTHIVHRNPYLSIVISILFVSTPQNVDFAHKVPF